ncbi:hypothetical protein F0A17_16585 [Billgrantia pellis]|uniref:Uncharacterized protein n=1 Tax=Billgrantia pellis TaxID=2606936 RepID=A0A7V7G0Y0_9GAMM|nr:hypothetical protein [Halomonas pellis]KAA0010826.1 hypothetical protein F0A17_16585 [Halomonas pellis]
MLRFPVLVTVLALFLVGCAGQPPEPDPVRRALQNLSERAVDRVLQVDSLQPTEDQVLLLVAPEVDDSLGIGSERFLENLTRALLGATDGPQVIDWRPAMSGEGRSRQWKLESRLEATAPRLTLSDRDLLPYRLTLRLYRPDLEDAVWQTAIDGAFDATAL